MKLWTLDAQYSVLFGSFYAVFFIPSTLYSKKWGIKWHVTTSFIVSAILVHLRLSLLQEALSSLCCHISWWSVSLVVCCFCYLFLLYLSFDVFCLYQCVFWWIFSLSQLQQKEKVVKYAFVIFFPFSLEFIVLMDQLPGETSFTWTFVVSYVSTIDLFSPERIN